MSTTIRILVIDGEKIILESVTKALKSSGDTLFVVTTADAAVEGLRLVRNNVYDVVFVDAALAGMNSTEVLRRIKSTSPTTHVIFMSGYMHGMLVPDELSGDVDGLLSKPFTSDEIRSLVSRILIERKETSA
jgi:DNA-binding NtrC family response regulator